MEKQFVDNFNAIMNKEKEKNIKFFQSVGDPDLTEQQINAIEEERQKYNQEFLAEFEQKGITRYSVQYNQSAPVIKEDVPSFAPTYDLVKNDMIRKRRKV